ncbi:MAG: DUF6056 family protein [Candidatus Contendobacter sp.]
MQRFNGFLSAYTPGLLLGILAAVVIWVLALFIALSFYNYPAADDFCVAAKVRQLGFLGAQEFWYQHWSGRYTLNAVWTALLASGDIVHSYRFPPVVLLVATWLAFSFLTAKIVRHQFSTALIFLWGGICTVLFIAGAPDPAQTFYWLGGSITYQMANICVLVLLGLLVWRETTAHDRRMSRRLFILASVLVMVTVGMNEVSLLLTGAILGGGMLCAFWTRRNSRAFWAGLLLIATVAALFSLTAPGNYQRYTGIAGIEDVPRPLPWLAALLYLPWVALRLLYWLSNLGLWASAFIALMATFPRVRPLLYRDGVFNRRLLLLPVLWIVAICMLHGLGFLINHYPLPERAESVIWLLFLLGWYPVFMVIVHFWIGDHLQRMSRRWILLAMVLLSVSLLGAPNIFEAHKDVYRGYRYDQELAKRFSAIQAAKQRGDLDLIVDSLSRPPRTLFATDIATNPHNFRNQCLREYYEVRSIRLGSAAQEQ